MLPDRISNPGPLTYQSGALPIALRGRATFVLTAKFVITSIWSAQKIFFIDIPMLFSRKTYVCVFVRIACQGDSNKYTECMIHKKLFKSNRYSCFRGVHFKFLYNYKFDLTAKSLVTNSVITRVLCNV